MDYIDRQEDLLYDIGLIETLPGWTFDAARTEASRDIEVVNVRDQWARAVVERAVVEAKERFC